MLDLSGKRILVTGASSGIGRTTAVILAGHGADLILNGRNQSRLEQTREALNMGEHVLAPLDIAANCDDLPSWIKELAGTKSLHGLVHCAGMEMTLPLAQVDGESFDRILGLNTKTALMLVKGVRQKKCHAKPCSIVLVSSVASLTGQAGRALYCASKGALNSMARSLAVELARQGIRVNTVSPGQVDTEMNAQIRQKIPAEQYQAILGAHPLGLGKPEDVARPIAFLLSDGARWITGTNLVVDGGYTAI